jgi:large conductance mechanosensitive channel
MGLKGFREFIMRGNLVELAVAFVIGAAFASLLKAFIADLITPILAAIGGKPNVSQLSFTINNSNFLYGDFINNLITFLMIAAVIYYFVVIPYNRLMDRFKTERPVETTTRDCPYCLSSIPVKASRCPFCTSQMTAGAPAPAAE